MRTTGSVWIVIAETASISRFFLICQALCRTKTYFVRAANQLVIKSTVNVISWEKHATKNAGALNALIKQKSDELNIQKISTLTLSRLKPSELIEKPRAGLYRKKY